MSGEHHHSGPGHRHDHAGTGRWRLALALGVTVAILGVEAVGAVVTGSLALLVDAGHMLTDSTGLVVALIAATLMARPASARRTWGWARAEVLAAAVQAAILLVVGVYAAVEGISRLLDPPQVGAGGMALVGALGLLGNVVALLVLAGGRQQNLNLRAAFLEVLGDALGSVAVLVSAAVVAWTGWQRADAVAGLVVAGLIVPRAVLLLRASGDILLENAPAELDLAEVRAHLLRQEHVVGVHDLHASVVSTGLPVLSAHVVLEDECFRTGHCLELLETFRSCLATHFPVRLEHCTLQLESAAQTGHAARLHA